MSQGRFRRAVVALVPAALGSLVLAGCAKTVDEKKAAKFVTSNVTVSGSKATSASCPKGQESKKGKDYTCTFATATGAKGSVTFHLLDDQGKIAPPRNNDVKVASGG